MGLPAWLGGSPVADRAYPLGYLPALDGLRGLMTLGVLAAHTRYLLMPGSIIFMDMFFTMSGYLITSLLLAEYDKRGRIDVPRFYVRRLKRLYPALLAMVAVLLVVAVLFSNELPMRLVDAAVALTYVSNYWVAFDLPGVWYTSHTWSLSLEEQFYLVWPVTFIALVRLFGISWRMVAAIAVMALAFWAWRVWLALDGASIQRLYNSFDTRADSLLVGCGVAVALRLVDLADYPRLCRALCWLLVPLCVFSLLSALNLMKGMAWYYYVSPFFGSIPAALAIAALVQPERGIMHAIYELPPFVFCGRICYGLYLWHYPIFSLMRGELGFTYLQIFLVGWPLAFLMAIASYYLLERRFMRKRPL